MSGKTSIEIMQRGQRVVDWATYGFGIHNGRVYATNSSSAIEGPEQLLKDADGMDRAWRNPDERPGKSAEQISTVIMRACGETPLWKNTCSMSEFPSCEPAKRIECDECYGDGLCIRCGEGPCSTCEGNGHLYESRRDPIQIGPAVFDLVLVTEALKLVAGAADWVTFSVVFLPSLDRPRVFPIEDYQDLLVTGPDWRVLVACLHEVKADRKWPQVTIETVQPSVRRER
jgi:hypothetical protein